MDRFFGLDKTRVPDSELALLTTVHDPVERAVIGSILEGEKIPYMIRERGSGEAVRVLAGYSMFGSDIFVRKDSLEQAQELLDVYRNGDIAPEDGGEEETDTEQSRS